VDGVIVVDKPSDWTSHDVVNRMRRLANTKKVGHLGTLDPMATGVLPLVIGRATRLARFFERSDKLYEAVVRFGFATDTCDAEGTPLAAEVPVVLVREDLERALDRFRGRFMQMPPAVSAKKIGGTPAYKLARQKLPVDLKAVEVEVYSLELLRCEGVEAQIRVHCTAGTYVRAIAHELGQALGFGAHLRQLRRISAGGFDLAMALTLDQLGALAAGGRLQEALIPAAELLPEFPSERVDAVTAGFIRQGRDFRVSPFRASTNSRYVKAVGEDGDLVAIGEAKMPHLYHPVLVL
jgi:tRNA pseudouridine55 synthase